MTEAEWLGCTDPKPMLEFLRGRASERKLRLFACACCRRVWSLMTDERSRDGVVVRERYEEGDATSEEVNAAADAASRVRADIRRPFRTAANVREDSPELGPVYAAGAASNTANGNYHPISWFVTRAAACLSGREWEQALGEEANLLASLLRDIAGPCPFRTVPLDPAWLAWNDGTVAKVAHGIYEERAFDRLPILADALEDAGCQDAEILGHCRQAGEHVRGCWVMDALTGRR